MRRLLGLGLLLAGLQSASAAWHQVFVPIQDKSGLPRLAEALGGLDPCGTVLTEAGIELPLEDAELAAVTRAGLNPKVLIADLEQHYADRLTADRNYGAYHTFSEGMAAINQLHADFPDIVGAPISLGTSHQGNPIWAFKVSDNPGIDEDEPEVLYGGYIHAREAITIEVLLHFLNHLTSNYGTDPRVTAIVDERELWFIPFMNPDGVLYNESTNPNGGGMWRKNRRNNGDGSWGVDLNRNYGYQWGYDNSGSSPTPSSETYRGPAAFSEPEDMAVRTFINSRNFVAALSYHSYSNLYIYPFGYTNIHAPEPDHSAFVIMTDLMSNFNGYTCGAAWELLYNTNGDTVDWCYGAQGEHPKIMAITPEVGTGSDGFWPAESRIPALVAENLEPNLLFAEMAGNPWSQLPPAAPVLDELGEVGDGYTLTWSTPAPDPNNPALSYELRELSGPTQGTDFFASAANWTSGTVGFALSTARSYSPPNSYFGGTGHNRNATAVLNSAIQVTAGMQLAMRSWYNIETNWDYGYVEVSTNGVTWTPIAGSITTTTNPNGTNDGNGITGASSGWVAATFPLTAYVGQSINVRLRYETDGAVLGEGFYVDDFSPVPAFASETTIADGLTAEAWTVVDQSPGDWYYKVRARDAEDQLSVWSNLIQVSSTGGVDMSPPAIAHTPLPDTSDGSGPWTVAALISDASGVASATLEKRVGGSAWSLIPMTNTAGNNWSAAIPGPVAPGQLVEYRIRAVDASPQANEGVSTTWSFQILLPVGLEYCQSFTSGFDDFSVVQHLPGGNSWVIGSYTGQGQTAYIQYSSTTQEDHASLLSPVFDCRDQGALGLSFWHLLRMGYSGAFTDAWVKGSVDGGLTWPYILGEWHADGTGGEVTVSGVNTLDISSWAAGQEQVRIKFEFHDRYDWYWHVDNVCLTGNLAVAPDPVEVTITALGADVLLSWPPSPGAAGYRVYVSDEAREGFTLLAQVAGTSHLHVSALSQEQRYYIVTAVAGARAAADPAAIPTLDAQDGRRPAAPEDKVRP